MPTDKFVHTVDELGRVVVPSEIRRQLNIQPGDGLEVLVCGESIILRKWEPVCVFCGAAGLLEEFRQKRVCRRCLTELAELNWSRL